jgi:hypothetical protein
MRTLGRDLVGAAGFIKPRRAARVRERSPRCLPEKWEDTYRPPQALHAGLGGWSSGLRSKASGRTAVWAGSMRTRFLCRSRFIHTTLSVMQSKAFPFGIWKTKYRFEKAMRTAPACFGTDRERDCAVRKIAWGFRRPMRALCMNATAERRAGAINIGKACRVSLP